MDGGGELETIYNLRYFVSMKIIKIFCNNYVSQNASFDEKTVAEVRKIVEFCKLMENSGKLIAILMALALFVFEFRKMSQQETTKKLVGRNILKDKNNTHSLNHSDEVVSLTKH